MRRDEFEKAVRASSLDGVSKSILYVMATYKNWKEDLSAWPSTNTLAQGTGFSRITVARRMVYLRDTGWLVDTGKRSEKGAIYYDLAIGGVSEGYSRCIPGTQVVYPTDTGGVSQGYTNIESNIEENIELNIEEEPAAETAAAQDDLSVTIKEKTAIVKTDALPFVENVGPLSFDKRDRDKIDKGIKNRLNPKEYIYIPEIKRKVLDPSFASNHRDVALRTGMAVAAWRNKRVGVAV